ncbi:hypothetical protein Ae201684P_014716 [Aphanomyces euteiches]|uniref:LNR domain-containing protein n=1 Tax=Aphanomyces euteiches TaxID=100861 RepID=A0A6G0WXR1_9STRA|nr:hypothetical protein Ae201684_010482 [Aphanomyces euteiches]KAF0732429.1 hypothetical protein Ae201684_010481 [Aphanomyces euteiches]KAH9089961.1 hypothetical protein Ae201684P_014716 [Aphanomyces euteiches]
MAIQAKAVDTARQPDAWMDNAMSTKFTWLRRLVYVFANVKHIMTAIYLASQVVLLLTTNEAQQRTSHFYAPNTVVVIYSLLVALHVASMIQYGSRRCRGRFARPGNKVAAISLSSDGRFKSHHRIYTTIVQAMSTQTFILTFNALELACQSYEAFELASKLVDSYLVTVYVLLVVLHACLTPLFLVVKRSTINLILLTWTSSLISFGLSCLIHFFGLIYPLLYYMFVDVNLDTSPTWLTHYILYVRYNFITSPTDFIAKVVVQMGSLASLWRLVDNVELAMTLQKLQRHSSTFIKTAPPTPTSRRALKLYNILSLAWGVILFVSLFHAMWFRTECPATCVKSVTPLWSTHCQCMFVHVNCHLLGHQDVEIRCDLRHGILNSTLHQFDQLYFIGIYFTNTTSWDGTFPATVNTVTMSYGALETIPSILERDIPASMVALRLSSHPFQAFEIPPAWHLVRDLRLVNLSHVVFDPTTLATFDFIMLVLAFANLTTLPPGIDAMSHLATVDVSGNLFDKAPRTLLSRQVQVIACGNPINLTEPLDPPQRLNFDWTQSTSCWNPCAPSCFPYMVADHQCQLACFTPGCNFDGGDCDDFGFDPPLQ